MRVQPILAGVATMALIMSGTGAFGQAATGSLDNFDCVNDTGETAEGFEIDIEDIHAVDLVREFPSNFAGQEYVNRFGIPTVSQYDNTATGGHIGVKVTWAAAWDGTAWRAKFGSYVYGGVAERDGVAYVLKPAATQGDSCWLLGQGAGYASSGCDHFGLSFAYGVTLGVQRYHWLVPDPANPGHLKQALWTSKSGPIPPAPAMAYVPPAPNVPAMIRAVAEAAPPPEPAEPQWGDARWAKITTAWTKSAALLDQLQKNLVPSNRPRTSRSRPNGQCSNSRPPERRARKKMWRMIPCRRARSRSYGAMNITPSRARSIQRHTKHFARRSTMMDRTIAARAHTPIAVPIRSRA